MTATGATLAARRRHRSCAGLTLIELLVALIIFALLGIMSYRAVASAADNRERIAAEFQRWHDIGNLFQITEIDLTQSVARPATAQITTTATLSLTRATDGTTAISFLKLDGTGGAVRRRGYRFDGHRILQLRWPGVDSESAPTEYQILDHVKALRCTALTADGQESATWPAPGVDPASVPAAIEIELELPDAGTLRRVFVLR